MPENERSEPSPEQIKNVLQQAILRNYPNPERRGCPGREALDSMAERKRPPEDRHWEHVTHCSPCYQEYLLARGEVLERRRVRRRIQTVGIAAGVGAIGLTTALLVLRPGHEPSPPPPVAQQRPAPERSQQTPAPPLVAKAVLNVNSVERGAGEAAKDPDLQRLPRARVELSLYLPPGAEEGDYDVQLLRTRADKTSLATFEATARVHDGLTVLRIAPDLSTYEPGTYVFSIRRRGESSRFQRFAIE